MYDKSIKCLFWGHPYVKSALDMACWDILGKVSGLSVCELMGGRFDDDILLYRAISQESPEKMAQKVDQYWNEGKLLGLASKLCVKKTTEFPWE